VINPKTNRYDKGRVDAVSPKDVVKDLCSEVEKVHKGINSKNKLKNMETMDSNSKSMEDKTIPNGHHSG
jgi:hypothetical protein